MAGVPLGVERAVDRVDDHHHVVAAEVDLAALLADRPEAVALIVQRLDARKAKNFAEADRIRTELAIRGIVLEDKPGGKTEWRRAV